MKLKDAQQKFLDRLLASLEKGKLPWRCGWDQTITKPYNAESKKHYTGMNMLSLWMKSIENNYNDPRWMTFNQAKKAGCRIKKGSVGSNVYHYSFKDTQTNSYLTYQEFKEREGDKNAIIVVKVYKVFNAHQIDGLETIQDTSRSVEFTNSLANRALTNLLENIKLEVQHGGNNAFYQVTNDKIFIPKKSAFHSEQKYYSTLFHEIAHATSHKSRLNREVSAEFGSEKYAIEELRAELSSAFLSLDLGFAINNDNKKNHQAYIQNWLKIIKDNPKVLFMAINDASKIHNYMFEKGKVKSLMESLEKKKEQEHDIHIANEEEIALETMKNSCSIAEYARDKLGMHIIKESKGLFRIEEHDSCKIYPNNTFYRFSTGVGGSIIDFIKHFEQVDIKESINTLKEYYNEMQPEEMFNTKEAKKSTIKSFVKDLEVPEKSHTNNNILNYLVRKRGIDKDIVHQFINRKILYEDTNENCVFLGKNSDKIYYAHLRGTSRKFLQDVAGSIKNVGIFIDNKSNTLIVNEAIIDQMSYMSLTDDPNKYNYLSVQGAANTVAALDFHLKSRSEKNQTKKIIIGLDNDNAGEINTGKAIDYLKQNYPNIEISVHIPENGKDFNEQLLFEKKQLSELGMREKKQLSDGKNI
ncbi:MAG: zincin-like metallopeptidase domain-containing protein [Breznakia sp.]